MKILKGQILLLQFILISNATLSQQVWCTEYRYAYNYKNPYCIKDFFITLKNNSEFKVKSVTGRLLIMHQASGYKYVDQKIKLYVSINPYSVKAGNIIKLKNYCFLQRANSFEGIYVDFSVYDVEWNKTAAQLAYEKRLLKESAEYNRKVEREYEAERKKNIKYN